jgi:hypothetical protein
LEERTLPSFLAPIDNRVGAEVQSAAVGDFNGDGNLDMVAVTSPLGLSDPGNLSVLLGNGDGSFQAPVNIPISFAPSAVAVGDFNGDGILDVVTVDSNANTVRVLLGAGDGTFTDAPDGSQPRPNPSPASSNDNVPTPNAVAVGFASILSAVAPPQAPPTVMHAGTVPDPHRGDWDLTLDAAELVDPLLETL